MKTFAPPGASRNSLATLALFLALILPATSLAWQEEFASLKAQGVVFFNRGQYEQAQEFFVKALKIRKEPECYRYLEKIFRQRGDNEYADKLAEMARKLEAPPVTTGPPARTAVASDTTPPVIEIESPQLTRGLNQVALAQSKTRVSGKAIDPSGISEVTVRGVAAALDSEGRFSAEILLKVGENKVLIVASDVHGNRAEREVVVTREAGAAEALPPTVATAPSVSPGKYYALIIGNNAYRRDAKIKSLDTPANDAQALAQLLQARYGFEVKVLLNATRGQIFKELASYRRDLEENTNLLIFYAGHGSYDKGNDTAYWLPVDADISSQAEWISSSDLTSQIKSIKSKHILVIADSCYSGALTREAPNALGLPTERNRLLQKMLASSSRTLMASGGNEPVADGGGGNHSIFAAALLNGLAAMEEEVFTGGELFHKQILQQVAGKADQKPQYDTIRNSGHDSGEFVFVRKRK